VQFYTKCAVVVHIRAVLTAYMCTLRFQQCDATPRAPIGELTAFRRSPGPGWILGERKGKGKGREREIEERAREKEREMKGE